MALRKANTEVVKIDLGDGDYIEVVSAISKKTFNDILGITPISEDGSVSTNIQSGLTFQTRLFGILVKGWSLPEPPTEEAYLELDSKDAGRIDSALQDHFNKLSASEEEATKSV